MSLLSQGGEVLERARVKHVSYHYVRFVIISSTTPHSAIYERPPNQAFHIPPPPLINHITLPIIPSFPNIFCFYSFFGKLCFSRVKKMPEIVQFLAQALFT